MKALLDVDEIDEVVDAALTAGLVDHGRRSLLMGHIEPSVWSSLPVLGTPLDQLRSDLNVLATLSVPEGSSAPLRVWLDNAERMSRHRLEGSIFKRFASRVGERLRARSVSDAAPRPVVPAPGDNRRRRTSDGDEIIASWVHLSDIHFGHGGAAHQADQQLILDALNRELSGSPPGDVPAPDMMLITGDIAFSGARRSADEYDKAQTGLDKAAKARGLTLDRVYAVPGNHDVDAEANVGRLRQQAFASYRRGEPLDDALADAEMLTVLRERQAGYLEFTAALAPACRALSWHTRIDTGARPLRLVGLNTALLADKADDKGKLEIGKRQFQETLTGVTPEEIVVVMSHHPLEDRWMRDQEYARAFLRRRAHVHLCGHVHDSATESARGGGGQTLVTVAAGATHNEAYPGAGHGFNYAAVIRMRDGTYAIRVWPRRFSQRQFGFVVDGDVVADGHTWCDHVLQDIK